MNKIQRGLYLRNQCTYYVVFFRYLSIVLLALASGCGNELVLPPAKPLSVDKTVFSEFYGMQRGKYSVEEVDSFLKNAENEEIAYRITYPDGSGKFPLIIFSHGNLI